MFVTRIWGLTQSLRRHVLSQTNQSINLICLQPLACETNPESESSSSSGSQSEDEMPVPDARLFSFGKYERRFEQLTHSALNGFD